ncbi:CPBP family intramembrane metalloprotease domain-containing protein, partial [Salinisphaera sp. USBA-960]|nr:CPBP family intramembrane metalloprotease domain-containing protein [Salifodinibacter halophilus]
LADPGTLWSVSIWGLLCAAAATLWWPKARAATSALLALALIAGFAYGILAAPALVSLALLGLAAWLVRPARPRAARIGGHVLFVLTAFALGLHLLPGFGNPQLVADLKLSAD